MRKSSKAGGETIGDGKLERGGSGFSWKSGAIWVGNDLMKRRKRVGAMTAFLMTTDGTLARDNGISAQVSPPFRGQGGKLMSLVQAAGRTLWTD